MPISLVLNAFLQSWSKQLEEDSVRFFGTETESSLTELGEELLELFRSDIQPRRVRAVEQPFTVPLRTDSENEPLEVQLVGIFDLLEEDEDGQVIVSELKTASKRFSDTQGENQLDGLVYGYAACELGLSSAGNHDVLIRYDILVKTKKPVFQQVYVSKGEGDYTRLVRWIQEVLHAVEVGAFYPNYGWQCQQCPFQKACASS